MSSSTTGAGSRDCYVVFDMSFDELAIWQDILEGFCLDKDAPVPSSMPVPGVHGGKRWFLVFGDAVPSAPPVENLLYLSRDAVLRLHAFKGFKSNGHGAYVACPLDLTDLCGRVMRIRVNGVKITSSAPSRAAAPGKGLPPRAPPLNRSLTRLPDGFRGCPPPEPSHSDEDDDGAARKKKKGRPRLPKAERTEEQVQADKDKFTFATGFLRKKEHPVSKWILHEMTRVEDGIRPLKHEVGGEPPVYAHTRKLRMMGAGRGTESKFIYSVLEELKANAPDVYARRGDSKNADAMTELSPPEVQALENAFQVRGCRQGALPLKPRGLWGTAPPCTDASPSTWVRGNPALPPEHAQHVVHRDRAVDGPLPRSDERGQQPDAAHQAGGQRAAPAPLGGVHVRRTAAAPGAERLAVSL